jgi:hypothetical protein
VRPSRSRSRTRCTWRWPGCGALGPAGACVVTRAPGYLLDLRGARVDAELFELRCRAARGRMDADPAKAARLFEDALAL